MKNHVFLTCWLYEWEHRKPVQFQQFEHLDLISSWVFAGAIQPLCMDNPMTYNSGITFLCNILLSSFNFSSNFFWVFLVAKFSISLTIQKDDKEFFLTAYLVQFPFLICKAPCSFECFWPWTFYFWYALDENLAWLTEELKHNKGNFTFPTHIQ